MLRCGIDSPVHPAGGDRGASPGGTVEPSFYPSPQEGGRAGLFPPFDDRAHVRDEAEEHGPRIRRRRREITVRETLHVHPHRRRSWAIEQDIEVRVDFRIAVSYVRPCDDEVPSRA